MKRNAVFRCIIFCTFQQLFQCWKVQSRVYFNFIPEQMQGLFRVGEINSVTMTAPLVDDFATKLNSRIKSALGEDVN